VDRKGDCAGEHTTDEECRSNFARAKIGVSTKPRPNASRSTSSRLLRVIETRKDIGVRNSTVAAKSGGSRCASVNPSTVATRAATIMPIPRPLQNATRRSRGSRGDIRRPSTHTLTAVRCAGSSRCQKRVVGVLITGSKAATIGNSRTPLSVTATAASAAGRPDPSAVATMTCAGPAQISTVIPGRD
jgi:hypothetical protein